MTTSNWMAAGLPADDVADAPADDGNWLGSALGDDGLHASARTVARRKLAELAEQNNELGKRIQASGMAIATSGRMSQATPTIVMTAASASRGKRQKPLADLQPIVRELNRLINRGVLRSI